MGNDYFAAILFFLPAGIANMTPVLVNKIPYINQFNTPLDFGKKWQGVRITGNHKTWRGLISGTLAGGLCAVIVAQLKSNAIAPLDPLYVGLLLGFGALAGDAIESFAKRRLKIPSGQSWFPFDQVDYIIGALLAVSIFQPVPLWVIYTVFVVYFGLHLLTSYIGFKLGLKDQPI